MPRYLADTSIWAWANKPHARPDITAKLAERIERGGVCTCVPVALEVMHRAATGAEYDRLFRALLDPLDWVELDREVAARALEVQRQLAPKSHGHHRRPVIDFLIADVAEQADGDVVLWFFDQDLRVISEHTRQPAEAETATGPGG